MLGNAPGSFLWFGAVPGELVNSEGQVWARHSSQIQKATDKLSVRFVLHLRRLCFTWFICRLSRRVLGIIDAYVSFAVLYLRLNATIT